jgi:hypothetical protein
MSLAALKGKEACHADQALAQKRTEVNRGRGVIAGKHRSRYRESGLQDRVS